MAEYIKREALVHRLKNPYLFNITQRIFDIVSEIPAADVAPVVHGRWIEDWSLIITCSECKRGYNLIAKYTHYCPNCGAKMDGERKDGADG